MINSGTDLHTTITTIQIQIALSIESKTMHKENKAILMGRAQLERH